MINKVKRNPVKSTLAALATIAGLLLSAGSMGIVSLPAWATPAVGVIKALNTAAENGAFDEVEKIVVPQEER